MQKRNSKLSVIDYELGVYIGVSEQEKKLRQKILISIKIDFKNSPKAIITDSIDDTLCYHNICNKLKLSNDKVYSTIEYLCNELYNLLYKIIEPNDFQLEVKKFPVIENLKGGVRFTLSYYKE